MGEAVTAVRKQIFEHPSNLRLNNLDIPKILVVLTDGQANDVKPEYQLANVVPTLSDYIVIAVGITSHVNKEQLRLLVGGDDSKIFNPEDFSKLDSFIKDVADKLCEPIVNCKLSEWSSWTTCDAECGSSVSGEKTQTRKIITPPSNGGRTCDNVTRTSECLPENCEVNCVPGPWTKWSDCIADCSSNTGVLNIEGKKTRTRPIQTPSQFGGQECSGMTESEICVTQCPIDCKVSEWTEGPCVAPCTEGGATTGTRIISRKIQEEAKNSGEACPTDLEKEKTCITECPYQCKLGEWGDWSVCDGECTEKNQAQSVGQQFRMRPIEVAGDNCGERNQTQDCLSKCKVDCELSEWIPGKCEVDCTGQQGNITGLRQEHKTVLTPPAHGGAQCGETNRTRVCTNDCGVSCQHSDYSDWKCEAKCKPGQINAPGVATRTLQIFQNASDCPQPVQTKDCLKDCPISCVPSNWVDDPCPIDCAGKEGKQVALINSTRHILTAAKEGGAPCGELSKTKTCEVDCGVRCITEWTLWSECNVDCSVPEASMSKFVEGVQTREKIKLNNVSDASCDLAADSKPCFETCDIDCAYTDWIEQDCNATCSNPTFAGTTFGYIVSTRGVERQSQGKGQPCGDLQKEGICTLECTPKCQTSEWSAWVCDYDCANADNGIVTGNNTRSRVITFKGDGNCGDLGESKPCLESCDQDCKYSDWHEGICDAQCGEGIVKGSRTYTRDVLQNALNNGKNCPELQKTEECTKDCGYACQYSDWGNWYGCDADCSSVSAGSSFAEGTENRIRHITRPGDGCPALSDTRACKADCPVDCLLEKYEDLGCDAVCENDSSVPVVLGNRTWVTSIKVSPQNNGKKCDDLIKREPCYEKCKVDCKLGEFVSTGCNASCGEGIVKGTITFQAAVIRTAQNGGEECPPHEKEEECEVECQVDCEVGDENLEKACTASCASDDIDEFGYASGIKTYKRAVTKRPQFGGAKCVDTVRYEDCKIPCPVPCAIGDWEAGDCNAQCNNIDAIVNGTRTFTRKLLHPLNGGAECPSAYKVDSCSLECDVDCQVSDWSKGEICEQDCLNNKSYNGTRVETRYIKVHPQGNGKTCPELKRTIKCSEPEVCQRCEFAHKKVCNAKCVAGVDTVEGIYEKKYMVISEHTRTCVPEPAVESDEPCTKACSFSALNPNANFGSFSR
eukprot:Pgem_evm2s9926